MSNGIARHWEFIVICLAGIGYFAKILELQTDSRVFECTSSKPWNIPAGLTRPSVPKFRVRVWPRTRILLELSCKVCGHQVHMYVVRLYLCIRLYQRSGFLIGTWGNIIAGTNKEGEKEEKEEEEGTNRLSVFRVLRFDDDGENGYRGRRGRSRAEI